MLKQSLYSISSRQNIHQARWFFYVLIASLAMFFAGMLITYLKIRFPTYSVDEAVPGSGFVSAPKSFVPLSIPLSFWLSTVILGFNSWFLQRSVAAVHRERQAAFRQFLLFAWWTAILFLIVQSFGMWSLFSQHFVEGYDGSTKFFGMSFAISLIHALHILAGLIYLGFVIYYAALGKFDHENHWHVDNCAGYWHFLGIVWLAMLATFYFTR